MKVKTMGTLAIVLLLIGSLFDVQADDKTRQSNLKPPGKSVKDAGHGEKDDQLHFRRWQKKVNCISCHGREKKNADWNLFPLHQQGNPSEKKWLKKTDCFSCHNPEKGTGMLLWPSLHKFNVSKK